MKHSHQLIGAIATLVWTILLILGAGLWEQIKPMAFFVILGAVLFGFVVGSIPDLLKGERSE